MISISGDVTTMDKKNNDKLIKILQGIVDANDLKENQKLSDLSNYYENSKFEPNEEIDSFIDKLDNPSEFKNAIENSLNYSIPGELQKFLDYLETYNQHTKINLIQKQLTEVEARARKLEQNQNMIYVSFIVIFGIFIALMFSLFGGFTSIAKILAAVNTDQSISRIAMSGSLIGIVLICLIFCLFQFLATISDKAIEVKKDGTFFEKYPIFAWSLTILTSIFILGFLADGFGKIIAIAVIVVSIGILAFNLFTKSKFGSN